MNDESLTIQKAGEFLGVSSSTLRRWEEKGVLIPERTVGNQRRYSHSALVAFRNRVKEATQTVTEPQQEVPVKHNNPIAENYIPSFVPPPPVYQQPTATTSIPAHLPDPVREEKASLTDKYLKKPGHHTPSSLLKKGAVFAGLVLFIFSFVVITFRNDDKPAQSAVGANNQSVLGIETKGKSLFAEISFFIPAVFNEKVTLHKTFQVDGKSLFNEDIKVNNKNVDLGTGKLTASNVLYSITAGNNVTISGDAQNPVISVESAGNVQSVQGLTGDVTFSGGTGITLEGATITNADPGSAQNIFKNVIVDSTAFAAGSNTDTLKFEAGTGITLTSDTSTKTITINSESSGTLSGLTTNGVLYALSESDASSTIPGTTGTVLKGVTGGAPVFSAVDLSADVANLLPTGNGGTGVGTTPSNGEILIGNGSGYTLGTISAGSGIGVSNGSGTISITNNGVTALTGTANQVNLTAGTGAITVSLPQNIHTGATPTFASMTLTANTNQLVLGTGNTGTITMATLTSGRTYTLPDASGDFCLTSGNCSGVGGITGSGTSNYIPRFTGATSVTDSAIYDSGGKIGIGTTSPQGLFSVSGDAGGNALATLNETSGQNILVGSSSGVTRFAFDSAGNLNIIGGAYQIGGTTVITSTSLGTGVTTSSLTSVGTLNSGAISSGFGAIDTGSDDISGGNLTATGTTGFIGNGNGAGLTFSGSGNHDITASTGTLRLGETTLNGAVTGNNQNITGLNNLSAAGTVTFSGFTSNGGLLYTNGSGQVAQVTAGAANQILHGGTTPGFGAVILGTETSGNYVANVATGSGLFISGTLGVGSTPTFSLGDLTSDWNQTGAFDITLNNANAELRILESAGGTFYGTIDVGDLSNNRTYTFPDTTGTVCLVEAGNCAGSGTGVTTAGGTNNRLVRFTGAQAVGNASINDLYTGVALTIDANGNLGIGATTPLAALDTRGTSATAPAASVSGQTLHAALVVDQTGSGDILTASKAGATKFTVTNTGNLQFAGNTNFTNIFTSLATQNRTYTLPDANGTICLSSGNCGTGGGLTGTGTIGQIPYFDTTGSLTSETTGFAWDTTNKRLGIGNDAPAGKVDVQGAVSGKALVNLNETGNQDILTGSASGTTRFVFDRSGNLNIIGGSYQIGGTSVLNSTTIGTGVTGSSLTQVGALSSGSIANGFGTIATGNSISGQALGISGTTVIDASRNLTTIAGVATDLTPTTNNSRSLGTAGFQYQNIYGQILYQNGNQVCDTSGNCSGLATTYWNQSNGALYQKNTTVDLLIGGISTDSAKFAVLNVNSATPTASLSGSTGGTYITANGTIQSTTNQTITIGGNSSGNIVFSPLDGNGTTTSNGNFNLTSGKLYQINGTTVLSDTILGSGVTGSSLTSVGALTGGSIASGFGTIVTGNTIQGTDITATGGTGFAASGNGAGLTFSGTGNHTISASTGTLQLGTATLTGDITGNNRNLTGLANLAAAGTVTFSSFTGNNAVFYGTSGTGQVASATTNTSGLCLLSGGSNPGWGTCPGGTNYWNLNNDALSPFSATADLLVGGIATNSAKIGLINANSGTPTATLSANSGNNATYISGNGVLGTTNAQTLTIGSNSTGEIIFAPQGVNVMNISTHTGKTNVGMGTTPLQEWAELSIAGNAGENGDILLRDGNNTNIWDLFADIDGSVGFYDVTNGKTPFAIDANTPNDTLVLKSNGSMGIGNGSPVGILDVRGTVTGKALSLLNETGGNDIFTASASGTTRLTLSNSGNLNLIGGAYQSNGVSGITQGSASCVTTTNGIVTGTGICQTGSEQWVVNNGTIYPGIPSLDLLIGGNTTASAKFRFINTIGSGAPTASISGSAAGYGVSLNGDGVLSTTLNRSLAINPTGGNVGIGGIQNPASALSVLGDIRAYDTGGDPLDYIELHHDGNNANVNINQGNLIFNLEGNRVDFANDSDLQYITLGSEDIMVWNYEDTQTNLYRGARGTLQTDSTLTINGGSHAGGKAALIVNQTGANTNDIFTASAAGTTRFSITNAGGFRLGSSEGSAGNCLVSGGTGAAVSWSTCASGSTNFFDQRQGLTYLGNLTSDFAIGGLSSASASFLVSPSTTRFTASISGNTNKAALVVDNRGTGDIFTASSSGLNRFVIKQNGTVGIGTDNPTSLLHLSRTTGTSQLTISSSDNSVNGNAMLQLDRGTTSAFSAINLKSAGGNGYGQGLYAGDTGYAIWDANASDIYRFYIAPTTGYAGVGAGSTPLAKLDVRGNTGAAPIASFSGTINSNAAFVVDNSGTGDIFTASKGGATKFVINNAGNVGIGTNPNMAMANGLSVGDGFNWAQSLPKYIQVFETSSGALGSAAYAGNWNSSGYWGLGAGTTGSFDFTVRLGNTTFNNNLSNNWALNQQIRLAINGMPGATALAALDVATASATLPVASFSGKTTNAIQIVDQSGTGDLFAASTSGTNRFVIKNNGYVGIGIANPTQKLHVLGNDTNESVAVFASNPALANDTTITIGGNDAGRVGEQYITYRNADTGTNAWMAGMNDDETFAWDYQAAGELHNTNPLMMLTQDGRLGIGTNTPLAKIDVRATSFTTPVASFSGNTGMATMVVDQNNIGDIFAASKSGALKFLIDNGGNIGIGKRPSLDLTTGATILSTGSAQFTSLSGAGLTDCDSSSNKLLWDATTKQFSCGTDRASATVYQNADQTESANSMTSSQLTFSIGANETYIVHINVNLTRTSSDGFRYQIIAPSGATCYVTSVGSDTTGTFSELQNAACSSAGVYGGGSPGNEAIDAVITTGATSGSVTLQFADNGGTSATIKQGSSLYAFKVGGADLAEMYYTKDIAITPGTVVSIDSSLPAGVRKTTSGYQKDVLGIISTQPGEVIGDTAGAASGRPVPVALSGRVPVFVTTSNGPIEPGDYLTASDIPGRAMRATHAGATIGKAMEAFDPANGKGRIVPCPKETDPSSICGSILTFVNIGSYNEPLTLDNNGNLVVNGMPLSTQSLDKALTAVREHADTQIAALTEKVTDLNKKTDELSEKVASTEAALTITDSLENRVASLEAKLSNNETVTLSTATEGIDFNEETFNNKVASSSSFNELNDSVMHQFAYINTRLSFLEQQASTSALLASNPPGFTASSAASLGLENATITGDLSIMGRALVNNVGVTGNINAGVLAIHGLDDDGTASIYTLSGPLKIQPTGMNGVDFMRGKLTIDIKGNLKTEGAISVKKVNVDTKDVAGASLGQAILKAGQTSIIIDTKAVTDDSAVFVTARTTTSHPLSVTEQTAGKSFKVEIDSTAPRDITFNWWIVN